MPQMSPMWWTSLMFMFILVFLFLMSILYFNLNYKVSNPIKIYDTKLIWKW